MSLLLGNTLSEVGYSHIISLSRSASINSSLYNEGEESSDSLDEEEGATPLPLSNEGANSNEGNQPIPATSGLKPPRSQLISQKKSESI